MQSLRCHCEPVTDVTGVAISGIRCQKSQSKYGVYGGIKMKLRPMADNILLKATESEETTSFGIILATSNKEKPAIYEVVSAGPGTKDVTVTVKPGDKVVVGNYVGSEIKLDGVDYKFVKQDDILAVVTD